VPGGIAFSAGSILSVLGFGEMPPSTPPGPGFVPVVTPPAYIYATAKQVSFRADARIEYEGDSNYFSSDNTFKINGIDITLANDAANKTFNIEIRNDTERTMDAIKNFVEEYNKMLLSLFQQYSTQRPRSDKYTFYEPLTDEEKRAMSDREVEMWEEKAKTGLLHRDDILRNIHSQMRSMMYAPVEFTREDGSRGRLHLFQIGITTSSANNNIGQLEIDEVALQRALDNDIEGVKALFQKDSDRPGVTVQQRHARMRDQGLGNRLNDIISNAIDFGGSIYNKAGFENTSSMVNNDLQRQINAFDTRMNDLIKWLNRRENYYYSLFARMENAMSRSYSQIDALMSSLG
jgi:flagellar hook-associated protein 2